MIQAPDLTPDSEERRCDEEEGQDPTNDDVDLGSNPREDSFALARKVDHAPPEKKYISLSRRSLFREKSITLLKR